jgi:hypothetical protein
VQDILDAARTALRDWEHADRGTLREFDAMERLYAAFSALDVWITTRHIPAVAG